MCGGVTAGEGRLGEDKRKGYRGLHREGRDRKRQKRASFFLTPLPPIEEADLQPWFGEGGEHKEDRSAVLPSECLGT